MTGRDTRRVTAETVDDLLRLLAVGDVAGLSDLFAPDGVVEFPFAPPGSTRRLDGRAAVRNHLRDLFRTVTFTAVTARTVHVSADPETAIAEFEVDGTALATTRPYRMRYIVVITMRDGRVALYRDYWNPLAAAWALDRIDRVVAAYTTEGTSARATNGAGG